MTPVRTAVLREELAEAASVPQFYDVFRR